MRTPKETAEHMVKTYGKNAGIHCTYSMMNNEGEALQYWREVYRELCELEKAKWRQKNDD
jgi:hypothetical protein